MELPLFLKSVDILSDLIPEEIAFLSDHALVIPFDDGTPLIKRGDIGRYLWIIYDGEVEVTLPDADGSEHVLTSLERGAILGEMSILTGEPAAANVTAVQSGKVIRIPRDIFSQVIARNLKTLGKLTRIITHRLLEDEKYEEDVEHLSAAHRDVEDPYDLNFTSVAEPMKILVVNSGSSSLKYALFDTALKKPLMEGLFEKIGSGAAVHKIKTADQEQIRPAADIQAIHEAFQAMIITLTDPETGVLKNLSELDAVGHRVVHGGKRFSSSIVVTPEVCEAIRASIVLAPLHNPYNLEGIEAMQVLAPQASQVAVFDTAFHYNMPESAATYALPYELCEAENIRKYGFHGTNHRFVAMSAATFLKKPFGKLKIISCHLGSGASVCAIDHGKSIDTSMGMTPLEGLVMGTRGGDMDPGILLHLMNQRGFSADQIDRMLNKESGLIGISGKSNDMREVLVGAEAGDHRCELAVSTFCYRVKKYIGAYLAALGGVDAVVFTGGIGENAPEIRARICHGLETFGIVIFDDVNREMKARHGHITDISTPDSPVHILVIPADEERMIARETAHALGRAVSSADVEKFRQKPIPLSTSAHHVHLSLKDFEDLFGKGRTMTPKSALSQPGQFAAAETVNLVGPKGRIEKVRILGPPRKESQVEIARTEEFKLGIDAPIRDSGDIEGTPGITIEGESGTVHLDKGVICAKRHIHMSPEEALGLGLRDKDVVLVRVKGVRELIFGDVLVRVNPNYSLDMHLDTDEANAAQITPAMVGYIESIQHRHYV